MKTLVIGDIQGCYEELLDLIRSAALTPQDRIIAVGDLVDHGPDSLKVLQFFRDTPNTLSVLGNHERYHIDSFQNRMALGASQRIVRKQFGEAAYADAIEFMQTLPIFIELEEAFVIHAFWEPSLPLENQKEDVLVGVTSGEEYIQTICEQPWWELYDGPKPLIAGHHDYSGKGVPLNYRNRVFCIDTGCCYGRSLTGLILPEFRFVSVEARENYWRKILLSGGHL